MCVRPQDGVRYRLYLLDTGETHGRSVPGVAGCCFGEGLQPLPRVMGKLLGLVGPWFHLTGMGTFLGAEGMT